ncbi:mannonate dehydratase [Amycolatopsis bartoniae]|uniref:Bifunctional D-altronate/D-mannonate dehydratase n=1 Tax=Amycolatopsis bartoniae TaxID=941986 RepID=A0A8H9J5C4_9PSEU|nr:D-mannonate dehydratase ManD [Amycolatopsis bartoniae]MBB2935584.1 mannonate dehydratase [Amycolatopsis bartoniae]TVT05233.1 D-galactonate dehydratase family protein [Amycolatopsis bartoniae]GHF76862.1 bifunctional D-altronate/D-mannonate dehydratase [Amycolatopsis bartoniae]
MTKIVGAEVLVTAPGRNYVTLKVTTDEGVVGWGDATLNGRELAVAAYLRDHVCPLLIGRDAHRIEDVWQYLYKGAYWRRGPVTMTAIAAVDVALWDIKGKIAGLPVYQLLGGAARDGVMVYGHASGRDVPEMLDDVARYLDEGYLAVRAQSGVPGLDKTYGIPHEGQTVYEPAAGARPQEDLWDTAPYLRFAPEMLGAVRERFGFGFHLLHDVHHRLTPIEAGRLGKDLEPHRMFWIEDPTPAEDQEAFRTIRQHTTTPLAVGEVFNSIWDCQHLITERLIDYVRTSVSHAGGITHLRRIFALADLYGVRSGSHGAGDLSPVSLAAALHVDLSVPNFGIQEYMGHADPAGEVFRTSYTFKGGYLHPGDLPGLGVEVDEEAAAKFPYDPKYLPVNRRRDGSVHDW